MDNITSKRPLIILDGKRIRTEQFDIDVKHDNGPFEYTGHSFLRRRFTITFSYILSNETAQAFDIGYAQSSTRESGRRLFILSTSPAPDGHTKFEYIANKQESEAWRKLQESIENYPDEYQGRDMDMDYETRITLA